MTTPDRLKHRQRRNDIVTALVAALCVSSTVYFVVTGRADDRCFRNYVAQAQETSQNRGGAVEMESQATRDVIQAALSARSRADVIAARRAYHRSLSVIDKTRDANPVAPPFNPERC